LLLCKKIELSLHDERKKMKPIPFNPENDLAPIPFNEDHLHLAQNMKKSGLEWKPHVGCFVWDAEKHIEAESPFPLRVYFILSLPRFISGFGSLENVAQKLVWLPTWHQARLIASRLGVDNDRIVSIWTPDLLPTPGEELYVIYRLIIEKLQFH
jgi:hypothetical protein